jgi:hypothetical protein
MFWSKRLFGGIARGAPYKNSRLKKYILRRNIFRGVKNKRVFLKGVVLFQVYWRGYSARMRYQRLLKASQVITRFLEKYQKRFAAYKLQQKILKIQAWFRGNLIRNSRWEISMKRLNFQWKVNAELQTTNEYLSMLVKDASALVEELMEENQQQEELIQKLEMEKSRHGELLQMMECPISMEVPAAKDIIFCTTDQRIYSRKALMRWKHQRRGELRSPLTREKITSRDLFKIYA